MSNECKTHGWWLEDDEQCPVCEGIGLERERIIALLEATYIQDDEEHSIDNCLDEYCPICDTAYSISGVIALIKGENNE